MRGNRLGLYYLWCHGYVSGGHRRTGRHPFGGADRVFPELPEWIQWGRGVVAEIFRDPYSVGGGGGSSRNFPGSILWWGG